MQKIVIKNACYGFSSARHGAGSDIITDIVIFPRNPMVRPAQISHQFPHSIEWNGDFGKVNLGGKWLNLASGKFEGFDTYNDAVVVYHRHIFVDTATRTLISSVKNLIIDQLGTVMFPKSFLAKDEGEFNCVELDPNVTELKLELNGQNRLSLTQTGLKAYRTINKYHFRLSTHRLTKQCLSSIKFKCTKSMTIVDSY
jgi:hypothetical protein